MPTIYRDKRTGIYYLNWICPEGGRQRQPVSKDSDLAKDKKYAETALAELAYKLKSGKLKKLSGITLNGLIDSFWKHYVVIRKTEQGQERDRYIFLHLLKHFGNDKLAEEINLGEIERYVCFRSEKVGNATINRELNTIKRMFRWAARNDLITENRISDFERLPVRDKQQKYFTPDKLKLLMTHTKQDFGLFLMFVLYTGIRITKALDLKWKDINFQHGLIETVAPKTGQSILIPLADDIQSLLKGFKQKTNSEESNRLFPWTYNAVRKEFARLRDKEIFEGVFKGFTLTTLRHTFATQSAMRGKDPQATSRVMGHSSLRTTAIYTHFEVERLQKAVSGLTFLDDVGADVFADIMAKN